MQTKKFKRIEFVLDNITDKKLIEWLEKQPNKSMYLRNLINEDVKKRGI